MTGCCPYHCGDMRGQAPEQAVLHQVSSPEPESVIHTDQDITVLKSMHSCKKKKKKKNSKGDNQKEAWVDGKNTTLNLGSQNRRQS